MAVYTEVNEAELASFLADYDLGHVLALKGIAEGLRIPIMSCTSTPATSS